MPIYEYECTACQTEQEFNQKISDDPLVTCPKCGKDALQRIVSSSSFALKGGGWYADGYGASAGGKKAADSSSSTSSGSTSSSTSSSSSGSDTKKASKSSD